jgi:hypothetical protein
VLAIASVARITAGTIWPASSSASAARANTVSSNWASAAVAARGR